MPKNTGNVLEQKSMNMGTLRAKGLIDCFPYQSVAESWRALNGFGHMLKQKPQITRYRSKY